MLVSTGICHELAVPASYPVMDSDPKSIASKSLKVSVLLCSVAGQVYLKRKAAAEMVLKDLVETVRTSDNVKGALSTVVNIMREHVR
jgi:hypothetical protein